MIKLIVIIALIICIANVALVYPRIILSGKMSRIEDQNDSVDA